MTRSRAAGTLPKELWYRGNVMPLRAAATLP
jgi:hypothetical protein